MYNLICFCCFHVLVLHPGWSLLHLLCINVRQLSFFCFVLSSRKGAFAGMGKVCSWITRVMNLIYIDI